MDSTSPRTAGVGLKSGGAWVDWSVDWAAAGPVSPSTSTAASSDILDFMAKPPEM
jgi:hypothetical protein